VNTATESIDKPWIASSTLRVRRHRERRREGLRLPWSVIQSVYAAQLSDRALNWLTDNAVITTEQRANAAAILGRMSDWLEQAPAR
jgi:hypothetical protein